MQLPHVLNATTVGMKGFREFPGTRFSLYSLSSILSRSFGGSKVAAQPPDLTSSHTQVQ